MDKQSSKYFHTARKMDDALLSVLEQKDFAYITIKEICEEAGVNRSTFYLHYENLNDLLNECLENLSSTFVGYFHTKINLKEINQLPLDQLYFLNDVYLKPFLQFVKDNRKLFQIAISQNSTFDLKTVFQNEFITIFEPILKRFHYSEKERLYVMRFYIGGFIAVIHEWIHNNCEADLQEIADIMIKCVIPNGNGYITQEEIYKMMDAGKEK